MVYQPSLSKDQLKLKFSKLRKLKYNRFRWWRMYDDPKEKLHPKNSLRDRIANGDFDYSHYSYQAMWCEYEMNDMHDQLKDDPCRYVEESTMLRNRRKRLLEDFEKEENEKLTTLFHEFEKNFKITREKVEGEMIEFDGSLLHFYYHIEDKYKRYNIPTLHKKRGRPAKN